MNNAVLSPLTYFEDEAPGSMGGVVEGTKERSKLPDGMNLIKRTAAPNQYYDVMLEGALVGYSEHQETWRGQRYWLFTDIEGTQKFVRNGRHHKDGAAWLKGEYENEAGPDTPPDGGGAGYDPDSKRRKEVETHAVKKIMGVFPKQYKVCHVGDLWPRPGYDIKVICPDGSEWHIEAKGTRDVCVRVRITEGERVHPDACPVQGAVHALCVVSGIHAEPKGESFECSGGTLEWVWPWKVTEKPGDPGLTPEAYQYEVPPDRQLVPPPLAPSTDTKL